MTDGLNAGSAIGAGAGLAVVDLVRRVLTPAADEVGAALGQWTNQRLRNAEAIQDNALAKMADPEDHVPPRLMPQLEAGSWTDETVVAEYLGGVIASSATPDGGDDRGVAYGALVNRLSAVQLAVHYVIHRVAREAFAGLDWIKPGELTEVRVLVPNQVIAESLSLPDDRDAFYSQLQHALYGLEREGLIKIGAFGQADDLAFVFGEGPLRTQLGGPNPGAFAAVLSRHGTDLFLWGLGRGQATTFRFFDPEIDMSVHDLELRIPAGALARRDLTASIVELSELA